MRIVIVLFATLNTALSEISPSVKTTIDRNGHQYYLNTPGQFHAASLWLILSELATTALGLCAIDLRLTGLAKAELGQRRPPVEILNACLLSTCTARLRILSRWILSRGGALALRCLLRWTILYGEILKLRLLLIHHHCLLHVDVVSGGRSVGLLLT